MPALVVGVVEEITFSPFFPFSTTTFKSNQQFQPFMLTKSNYLKGLQCPKLLWKANKKLLPEPDALTLAKFQAGNEVGELAKQLYPEGINIETDFKTNLKQTKELLSSNKPLFEAGILTQNLYSRADILKPNGDGWDILEVKSSTKVKDINIEDVSFQKYVYELAGLKIYNSYIIHINNKYIKKGKINPKEFFTVEDITKELNDKVSENIKDMLNILSLGKCPETNISKNCKDPYKCDLYDECWKLPKNNVFCLYRGGKKCFELYKQGIKAIKDIPNNIKLNEKQTIQKEGKTHINKKEIKNFLKTITSPVYYLDFETFSTAIPIYNKTKPYQQIPFQFSLHIVKNTTKHHSFLAKGNDPRIEFIKELKKVLGNEGSIIVYNKSFEIRILKELAEFIPEESKWIESVIARIIDLLLPFRNFHYYNPKQEGSCSIKKVMPALTNKDYNNLEINKGDDASLAYMDIAFGNVSEEEKQKIRNNLLEYCKLDTEGMIHIIDELKKLV